AEAIPHQIWGYLPDESMNYCNQHWSDYSGLSVADAPREGWGARIHPADLAGARKAWEEARSGHVPYQLELRLRGADGSYRRFVSRAVPLFDEAGRLIQWFGTNSDVEDARRDAEALHDTQAELANVARLSTLGELTASLAHELNQPLAAIAGNGSACLRWLDREQPDIGEAMQAVQRIVRDARRAADVIAHTRALVKKSLGEKGPVDVTELIREALPLVRPELQRHHVVIQELLAEDLPSIIGDRIQLQQLVLNLIVNGIDAMADVSGRPRTLLVSSRCQPPEEGAGVLVAVTDAGIGVAGSDLGRLFEAFYTTKPSGLGVGLSISRSIVEAHGGRLWATRNADHGLTVHFTLPQSAPSATYTKV
ncbi:MAG TPA: ATP-binding protein, partial [Candidatus Binatia bacterium]|nr:ATP-binding protein [Candidatus Binatia bacterium]